MEFFSRKPCTAIFVYHNKKFKFLEMADFLHLQRKILGGERFNRWLAGASTSSGCKCERKPSDLDMSAHSRSFSVPMWILYSQGRLWVHHQSSAEDHHRFSFLQWLIQDFFVCLCMQISVAGKKPPLEWWSVVAATAKFRSGRGHHHRLPFQWWPWTQAQVVNSNSTSARKETCPHHLGVQ